MPAELSAYEKQRLKNIEENRRVLAELGIYKSFVAPPRKTRPKPVKRKRPDYKPPVQKVVAVESTDETGSNYAAGIRRSRRIKGQDAVDAGKLPDVIENEEDASYRPVKKAPRENVFGAIPGIEVGTTWWMRMECSHDGVHRPPVSGIHGNEQEGCYSLALSGGYEDDLDCGDCFTYTGEGGRDLRGTRNNPKNLRTAPQTKDQTLTRGNLALSRNAENKLPIRVIRGYKLHSPFAPEEGYRYDGLYTVERYWFTMGLSGHGVFKFALKRCPDQAPPPWDVEKVEDDDERPKDEDGASDSGFSEKTPDQPSSPIEQPSSPSDEKDEDVDAALDPSDDLSNETSRKEDQGDGTDDEKK